MVDLGILYACRRLKEYFSDSLDYHDTSILLVNNGKIINHKYKLSRQSFNNLILPKINEAIHVAELAVQNAQSKDYNIDKILLIGGSSKITLVHKLLQSLCPKCVVETCGEKDIVVALGNIVDEGVHHSQNQESAFSQDKDTLMVTKEQRAPSVVYQHENDGKLNFNW